MSVAPVCKNCGVGRVRPFQFSIIEAVLQCENAGCDSFLKSAPWDFVIKQTILPKKQRNFALLDWERFYSWNTNTTFDLSDIRSTSEITPELYIKASGGVQRLPTGSGVDERHLSDPSYISNAVNGHRSNSAFFDLLCDFDCGTETELFEKENLSNTNTDIKCASTDCNSWMEPYKHNAIQNHHKSHKNNNILSTDVQTGGQEQVFAFNQESAEMQFHGEFPHRIKNDSFYNPPPNIVDVDESVKHTFDKPDLGRQKSTLCNKQPMSTAALVFDEENKTRKGSMQSIQEENIEHFLKDKIDNISELNAKSVDKSSSYNFRDLLHEDILKKSVDKLSISTYPRKATLENEKVKSHERLAKSVVVNRDIKNEHQSYRVNESSCNELALLNLGVSKDNRDTVQLVLSSDSPNQNKISPNNDLRDGDSRQSFNVPADLLDINEMYSEVIATDSHLSEIDITRKPLIEEIANKGFKKNQNKNIGRGRGRGKITTNEGYQDTNVVQGEIKKCGTQQSLKRTKKSKINMKVVPRQTRQRTGTIEVQAPRALKRTSEESSHDTSDPHNRSSMSTFIHGTFRQENEDCKRERHNITNLSYRSLLSGSSAEDPWSVPEFFLEGLDIEIVVQGVYSKSEDDLVNSTHAGEMQMKDTICKTGIVKGVKDESRSKCEKEEDSANGKYCNAQNFDSKLQGNDLGIANKFGISTQENKVDDNPKDCSQGKCVELSVENVKSKQEKCKFLTVMEPTISNLDEDYVDYGWPQNRDGKLQSDHNDSCSVELQKSLTITSKSEIENHVNRKSNILNAVGDLLNKKDEMNLGDVSVDQLYSVSNNLSAKHIDHLKSIIINESLVKEEKVETTLSPESLVNENGMFEATYIKDCKKEKCEKERTYLDLFKLKMPEFTTKEQETDEWDNNDEHYSPLSKECDFNDVLEKSTSLEVFSTKPDIINSLKYDKDSCADVEIDLPPIFQTSNAPNQDYLCIFPEHNEIRTWLGYNRDISEENENDDECFKLEKKAGEIIKTSPSTYFSMILEDINFDDTFFQCPSNECSQKTFEEHLSSTLFFGETAGKSTDSLQNRSFRNGKLGEKFEKISNKKKMKNDDGFSYSNKIEPNVAHTSTASPQNNVSPMLMDNKRVNKKHNTHKLDKKTCKRKLNEENALYSADYYDLSQHKSNNILQLSSACQIAANCMEEGNNSELVIESCSLLKEISDQANKKRKLADTKDQGLRVNLDNRNIQETSCSVKQVKPEGDIVNVNDKSKQKSIFLCIQEKTISDESNDELPIVMLDSDNDIQILVPNKNPKQNDDGIHFNTSLADKEYINEMISDNFQDEKESDSFLKENTSHSFVEDSNNKYLTCGIFDNSVPHDKKCYSPKMKMFRDFTDTIRDITQQKRRSYIGTKSSQNIDNCLNLADEFNQNCVSSNDSGLTVLNQSPSHVSYTDIITSSPGFGCTKFSPQHGLSEYVKNRDVPSGRLNFEEFSVQFLCDETSCEEPFRSMNSQDVSVGKSNVYPQIERQMGIENNFKNSQTYVEMDPQPLMKVKREVQSTLPENNIESHDTDILSKDSGKNARVMLWGNSADLPAVPVTPLNQVIENQLSEVSFASTTMNAKPLKPTSISIGVENSSPAYHSKWTEDPLQKPKRKPQEPFYITFKSPSTPVTSAVNYTKNSVCKSNLSQVNSKRTHGTKEDTNIDCRMPLQGQRSVLIPPALASSYGSNFLQGKGKHANAATLQNPSSKGIFALTTHSPNGPVTQLLRVNTLVNSENNKDKLPAEDVSFARCTLGKYFKDNDKKEDTLGSSVDSQRLPDVSKTKNSEEENDYTTNTMIKKVRMGSKGGFYLRPSPALMNAIAELRSKTCIEENNLNFSKSNVIKLPDGNPISHPIHLPLRSTVKKPNYKVNRNEMNYLTEKLLKEKIEQSLERSRKDNNIPEMVAVCIQGKLHLYCRNNVNSII